MGEGLGAGAVPEPPARLRLAATSPLAGGIGRYLAEVPSWLRAVRGARGAARAGAKRGRPARPVPPGLPRRGAARWDPAARLPPGPGGAAPGRASAPGCAVATAEPPGRPSLRPARAPAGGPSCRSPGAAAEGNGSGAGGRGSVALGAAEGAQRLLLPGLPGNTFLFACLLGVFLGGVSF